MATTRHRAITRPRSGQIAIRTKYFSARVNYRVLGLTAIAALIVAALAVWAMTLGSYPISFGDVVKAVVGKGQGDQAFIVQTLRLPRVLCALLVGASFAMSGAIFQGLVQNPLVSPDIIGINSGATVAAVFWIVTLRDSGGVPLAALAGALITAAAIYLLSWKRGISTTRLVLVGIGVAQMVSAVTTYLLVKYPIDVVRDAQLWSIGSLFGSNWHDVRVMTIALLVLIPGSVALTWPLNALRLGDKTARGLGIPLERTRLALIVAGCALAAIAIAVAGPIGFVALMIPQVARMLAGPLSGSVIILAGILGAGFLLGSDTIAQHFLPVNLPVGVVTSAVGAPYFLFLLYRTGARI